MDQLCSAGRPVHIAQSLCKQWRNHAFWISVVAVVVLSGTGNPIAAYKSPKLNAATKVDRRVPPAKSDLSGTVAG
jgi:hypothetical protein